MKSRLLLPAVIGFASYVLFPPSAGASIFGAMHLTDAQEKDLTAWVESLSLSEAAASYVPQAGAASVLNHFHYTPSLRNQAPTGTCWAWTSTAIMSMDFDRQFGGSPVLQEGLSVQFLASNAWMVGSNLNSGGHYGKTEAFYEMLGYAIPFSNTGAAWDTEFAVGEVRPSAITSGTAWSATGNTCFPVSGIEVSQVRTWDVTKEEAIKNLKSALDTGHPVGLLFFLPTTADWDTFDAFWANDPESTITSFDFAKGHTWDEGGCGHWVILVGYDDTDPDPAKHYWTILNTHGISQGRRPQGTFRLAMRNIDYAGTFSGNPDLIPYIYCWVRMDTTFAAKNSPLPAKGVDSISLSADNSLPASTSSVLVTGASFPAVPTAIAEGRLSINFLTIPCNATTGTWTSSGTEFRYTSKRGQSPAVTLSINKTTKKWSASVRGPELARKVSSSDGLVAKFEYIALAGEPSFTLLSQRGAVFDRVSTKASASLKGP